MEKYKNFMSSSVSENLNEDLDATLIKTTTYTGIAGGNMGMVSRQYIAGKKIFIVKINLQ